MPTISQNVSRKCFAKEKDIPNEFRTLIYPLLNELDLQSNNMICATKELFTVFTEDRYIKDRIKYARDSYTGGLILKIQQVVKKYVDKQTDLKQGMVSELADAIREHSRMLDVIVTNRFNLSDEGQQRFVQDRFETHVVRYNEMAEEERRKQCLKNAERELKSGYKNMIATPVIRSRADSDAPQPPAQGTATRSETVIRSPSRSGILPGHPCLSGQRG